MSLQTSQPLGHGSPDGSHSGNPSPSSEDLISPTSKTRSHESIWKRSKKILGVGRFEFLRKNYAETPSDKGESSEGKPGTSEKPAISKRREQVRRAQKTHRQRTEHYIKALEQEVLRLQKVEEEIITLKQQKQEEDEYVRGLEQQVVRLQTEETATIMMANSDIAGGADVTNFLAKVSVTGKDRRGRSILRAELPENLLTTQVPTIGGTDYELSPNTSYWDQLTSINPFATHQNAIDFVLFLEFGCMDHAHAIGNSPSPKSSGHTLTASCHFLEQQPQPTDGPATWNASTEALDRLFYLSNSFDLTQELTPIQAWNEIWKNSDAPLLQQTDLEFLKHELRKITSCYGFGGAIDATAFSAALDRAVGKMRKRYIQT